MNTIQGQGIWETLRSVLNQNFEEIKTALLRLNGAAWKNAGYYVSASSLNDNYGPGEIGTIAYIGTSAPYSIYEGTGVGWRDTGETFTPPTDLTEYAKSADVAVQYASKDGSNVTNFGVSGTLSVSGGAGIIGDVDVTGNVEIHEGYLQVPRIITYEASLGSATASVLNLKNGDADAATYLQKVNNEAVRLVNLAKEGSPKVVIRTGENAVLATTAEVQEVATDLTQAEADIETLEGRVDELDGNVTVEVNPAGGTFYRYGEACTDNWCEKFVAGGIAAVRVETTDAARKFNLREQPSDGIYISSGQMQGWRIVAPDGYRIKGYRLSAVLRTEGQATITASTGQEIVVTQEHGASLAVTGLNAQETTFMTTDSSTIWADRQIWILTFEIYLERTDRFALQGDVDTALQTAKDYANGLDRLMGLRVDAISALCRSLGSFPGVNQMSKAFADEAPAACGVMMGTVLNAQGYNAFGGICLSVPYATGAYGGFFQAALISSGTGSIHGWRTRTVSKQADGTRTATAWA